MMKLFVLAVTFLIGLSGCSASHTVTVVENANAVKFSLRLPEAGSVDFASSIDNYRLHNLRKKSGRWEVRMPSRAEFTYFYIVDGSVYLPECRFREHDDFGMQNCLYVPNKQ